MATELVKVCDFCATEDDTRTPNAETVALTIGGVAYEVEACERHLKTIEDLGTWLAEHARKVTASGKVAAISLPYVCEVCGRGFARPNGLSVHTVRSHAKSPTEPAGAAPDELPGVAPSRARVLSDGRVECPVCRKPFKNRSSLGVHVYQLHNTNLGTLEGNPRKSPK